jgi:hypothetical protein
MSKKSDFKDKIVFVVLGVSLLLLLSLWNGYKLMTGTSGNSSQDQQKESVAERQNDKNTVQKSNISPAKPPNFPIAKLFLGRRGVSEDQITWYDVEQFGAFIKQLQKKGVKEVHYTLLPDSIERYEEKWAEELKQANMRSYIEAD